MRIKTVLVSVLSLVAILFASCTKEPFPDGPGLLSDDKKIDIKGSLMNGSMKHPNIEANYWGKTVYVYFHKSMGECIVSISNQKDEILFADTLDTYPEAVTRCYMGDFPKSRYHLVIRKGVKTAEGWFNNYRLVAYKTKSLN